MNKVFKKAMVLTLALALALSMGALIGCGSDSASGSSDDTTTEAGYTLVNEGQLTIGSDLAYPPFESMDGETPTGFSIDLMEAICEELGLECNYLSAQKFDTLIPTLASNTKMDVAVSSITITDERLEEVDFSDAYLDSNQSLAVMKDSGYESADDLAGKKIGVQSGTTGETWAEENIEDAEVVAFDDTLSAFAALQAGKVDAVANDLPVSAWLVKNSYTDAAIIEEIPTGEQYGIAVSKDNPELTAAINEALATLKSNGTYDEIYNTYFGTEE